MYKASHMLSPGTRIKMMRVLLGISREDFCSRHGVNFNTMTSIELDRLKISKKQLNKIILAFSQEGLYVEAPWILESKGTAPSHVVSQLQQTGSGLLETWAHTFTHHRDSVIFSIQGDEMEPFYAPGDWVGGVWTTAPQTLVGKKCIGLFEHGVLLVGTLGKHLSLIPSNLNASRTDCMTSATPIKIAEILWHFGKHFHKILELSTLIH